MQLFRRIGATVLVVIVIVSITASCFASAVPLVSGIDAFTALYNAYLVAHGLVAVGETDGVAWTVEVPANQLTLKEMWQANYDYYSTLVDETVTDIDTWWKNHRIYMGTGYIDSNGNYNNGSPPESEPDAKLGLGWSAQLVEWFDKFTNAILKDKYDLISTDSGFQHSSGSFDSSLVSNSNVLPYSSSWTNTSLIGNGLYIWARDLSPGYQQYYYGLDIEGGFAFLCPYTTDQYSLVLAIYDPGYNTQYRRAYTIDGVAGSQVTHDYLNNSSGVYKYNDATKLNRSLVGTKYLNPSIPIYDSLEAGLSAGSRSSLIRLRPQDKYADTPIPVPDTDSSDYVPEPLTVPLNIPYISTFDDPDFTDDTDSASEAIIDAINTDVGTNSLDLVPPSDSPPVGQPSPVMPPFLPSQPPPFNFNFGGIWYYVVRWVNSIRSGTALIFSVLNNIPPAMFYPVFGSAVVVIVIGVWRRFFS